jgi:hypothetical protein
MRDERRKAHWVVICSCGFTRERISDWAANSVSKLHKQLGPGGIEHVTRVEAPTGAADGSQLPLISPRTRPVRAEKH